MRRPPTNTSRAQKGSSNTIFVTIVFIVGFFLGHIHAQLPNEALLLTNSGSEDCSKCPQPSAVTNLRAGSGTSVIGSNSSPNREYGQGWHSIEVFYGQTNHLESMLPPKMEWFSQARQDIAIATLLKQKRNGFFIDLAANDATFLSNTYSLEKKLDWTGLCIEPNPIYWTNLTFRDCQIVAAVVGNQRMEEVHFRFEAGTHGGIVSDDFDNRAIFKDASERRYTVTLSEIFTRFDVPKQIDYLSLDVEGAEEFIMKNFPLQDYQISLMTVERAPDSLKALFEKNGFQNLKRLSRFGETLWAHQSVLDTLDLTTINQFAPIKELKPENNNDEKQKI